MGLGGFLEVWGGFLGVRGFLEDSGGFSWGFNFFLGLQGVSCRYKVFFLAQLHRGFFLLTQRSRQG